ncbi:MAG: HupE/UreJ family protein [Thiotrichaceae bacterium]
MVSQSLKYFLSLLLLLILPLTAAAHSPSSSYLFLNDSEQRGSIQLQWDIALRDLEFVIGLDSNLDQKITWQEVKAKRAKITTYAFTHLELQNDQQSCPLADNGMQIDNHTDGAYVVLHIQPQCDVNKGIWSANYSLLFADDPDHRGVVIDQRMGYSDNPYILSPENNHIDFVKGKGAFRSFVSFIQQGIWHILIGFDHILFIIILMLPAVLVYKDKKWDAVTDLKPAISNLFKVVTAFTIAHSITLSLATLDMVSLPSRWVESAIALSVILVAINNIKPIFTRARWSIAFIFGLLHGFGFASVLGDLNLDSGSLALSLLGFNLGVELGQGFILLLLFPAAYILRKTFLYRFYILKGGSLLVSTLASVWLVQRVMA